MRNPTHSVAKKLIAIVTLAALCFVSFMSTGSAQCNGNCSGACTYGVEGSCVPKRGTYGHHVTTWRQWPEKAPAVPKRMPSMSGKAKGDIQLDLPDAGDESDPNPEFSHLRNSGDLMPSPTSSSDYSIPAASDNYSINDLSTDASPSVGINEDSPNGTAAPFGRSGGAVDLPAADAEGESSREAGDLLDGPSPILDFESRIRPNPTRSVAVVSHQAVDEAGNPLRVIKPIRAFDASATTTSFKSSPLRSIPLGNANRPVNRTRNPLR